MFLNRLVNGLTTTSSVLSTRSTTRPNLRPSACNTATYTSRSRSASAPRSASPAAVLRLVRPNVSSRRTRGRSLPRSRYTDRGADDPPALPVEVDQFMHGDLRDDVALRP